MYRRSCLAGAFLLAAFIAALAFLPSATAEKDAPVDPPHDLIVAMDVSGSMVHGESSGKGNDPQGIRWDGLQFLIDIARNDDRLCLVLFSGDAAVPTMMLGDDRAFIQMDKKYDHPAKKKEVEGRQLLKDLVKELQQHEADRGAELRKDPKDAKAGDDFLTFELETLGKKKFVLHHWTSVVDALKTITNKAKLLEKLRPGNQPWLFLFTDGIESFDAKNDSGYLTDRNPAAKKDHQFKTSEKDFAYMKVLKASPALEEMKELAKRKEKARSEKDEADLERVNELEEKKKELEEKKEKARKGGKDPREIDKQYIEERKKLIEEVLKPHVQLFQKKQVRAFTFALGDECDEQMLRAITDATNLQSEKDGRHRIGAYYHAKTNLLLLERLQQVCWELRQYWVWRHEGTREGGKERFLLPEPGPWYDMGLLLYREREAEARAPGEKETSLHQSDSRKPLEWEPLRSRSHLFYSLGASGIDRLRERLQAEKKLVLDVGGANNGLCQCVCVVRTDKPLFSFEEPPNGATYTPLDAIGFRVEFRPANASFKANQFEVRAQLIPVARSERKRELILKPEGNSFRGELILDPEAKRHNPELLGLYEVQIVISARSGPLKGEEGNRKGAERKLIRTIIKVVDYPALKVQDRPVVLTNTGKSSFKGEVVVSVPIERTRLGSNVARVVATVEPRLVAKDKGKGSPEIEAGKFRLLPENVELRGGQGVLNVELPAQVWSRLPAGKYEVGKITFRAPWSPQDSDGVKLVVEKTPWKLAGPAPVVFDFSRRRDKELTSEVAAKLKTMAPTDEDVWLSTSDKAEKPVQEAEIEFKGPAGQTVKLKAKGLGRALRIDGNGPLKKDEKFSLTLTQAEDLPLGECTATIYLVGPAVTPVPVSIRVSRQRFELAGPAPVVFDFSRRRDKELTSEVAAKLKTMAPTDEDVWLSTSDKAEKPVQEAEIEFKGPAGQTVKLKAKGLGRALRIDGNGPLKKDEKFSLTLTQAEDLPLGECTATLYLIGPAVKPVEVPIRVRRQRFKLQAPDEIVFDLSSKKGDKATGQVPVTLDTDLDTDEDVWLSDTPTADSSVRNRDLSFLPREKGGKPSKLSVAGLGNRTLVKSLTTSETSKLAITLGRPREGLPSGWYESKLYLVGTAVESRELKVKVKVDQPIVFLLGDDGQDVRRIDELSLLGLAGRTFRCALKVRTELEQNSSADVYDTLAKVLGASAETRLRLSALDELPLVFRSSKDRLWVELSIPASVREGSYQTRLGLNLSVDKNRPLVLELPVRVQVAHFAVRPHETGTLKLQVGQDAGMRVTKKIQLTTQAKRDQVVRWSVKRVPLALKGLLQPLEEKRLTVRYNDKSVVEEKDQPAGPNTPLVPGEKCDLTIDVDCAGLAPGWYHVGLHFQSSANDQPLRVEGFSEDLAVEVLVPGRDLRAMQVEGSKARVDASTPVRVGVTSHGCDLGRGGITPVDDRGKAIGPVQPIEAKHKIKEEADPQDPSLRRAEFVVEVTPRQAGSNTYLVTWPRYFPSNDQEGTQRPPVSGINKKKLVQQVTVVADGRIEVKPEVGFVGEQVQVQAVVAPSASKGPGGLTLQAAHPDQDPVSVDLRDPLGRGLFTGSFLLTRPGVFTLSLPGARGWRLASAQARAGFLLERKVREAEMRYGGGGLMQTMLFWDRSLESVSMRDVVWLENKEAAECRWQARLLYPQREHESQRIVEERDLDTVEGGDPNPESHLNSRLVLQSSTGSPETELTGVFGGRLKNGQVVELKLESALSEDAVSHLYGNKEGEHLTLGRANGMLVELKLAWYDAEGMRFGERTLRLPVVVKTTHWGWRGTLAGIIYVIVGGLGLAGFFRLRSRWNSKTESQLATTPTDDFPGQIEGRTKRLEQHSEENPHDEPPSDQRNDEPLPGEFR